MEPKKRVEKLPYRLLITQISVIFRCVSNLCNRSLIDVIRDLWTLSEIPEKYFDNEQ
jgi:hypothetical protein